MITLTNYFNVIKIHIKQLIAILTFCCVWDTNSFSQPFTLQTGIFPASGFNDIDWADYDNDGDLDYLIFYNTGVYPNVFFYVKVFDNAGNGNFSEAVSIPVTSSGNSISWFDYDKDGDLDIFHVSGGYAANGVEIYRNNGNKVFTKIADSFINEYDGNNAVGDFNNDGYPDIIYNGHLTNKTYLYLNNGNSTFSEVTNHPIIGLCYGSFDLRDFDGNGYQDILISGHDFVSGKDYTKIYKNNGNITFSEIAYTFTGVCNSSGLRGTPSRWADIDKDGDLDVVQVGKGNIYIYKNNGIGSYEAIYDTIPITGIYNGSVSLGDYDNDSDLDILVSGSNNNALIYTSKVFNNSGKGSFAESSNITLSDKVAGITHWVDYDGDGDLEIVLRGLLYRNDRIVSSLKTPLNKKTITLFSNLVSNTLIIDNVPPKSVLFVFSVNGKLFKTTIANNPHTEIPVNDLPAGIYLLKIDDSTIKFVKLQ